LLPTTHASRAAEVECKASNDVALFRRSGSLPVPWKSDEFGQLFQYSGGISGHGPADRDEFDDVDAPLAPSYLATNDCGLDSRAASSCCVSPALFLAWAMSSQNAVCAAE
jgi:hypothetical protein